MLDRSRRGRGVQRAAAAVLAGALALVGLAATAAPRAAQAMCCVCKSCGGTAFCTDGVADSVACADFCVASGCNSTVYNSADVCLGGCAGQVDVPTATPSDTATATPTATASETPTATATESPTPSPSETATITTTPTETPTPSTTVTASPSPSPTATSPFGGHIRYYTGNGPVPGADVALLGATPDSSTTDASGAFGFDSFPPGAVTLQPAKQDDFNSAITALDAAFVLQFVAGLRDLTPQQKLAADVTGDGTISALDATRILQFQVDIIQRFVVADHCHSDFVFLPDPAPAAGQTLVQPLITPGQCRPGAIEYSAIFPPVANQDFIAILFGDVTGNWTPPDPTATPTP
jgi:hypothetical protein